MADEHNRQQAARGRDGLGGRLRTYVLGLGIGPAAALYGVLALLTRRTFLPGYQVQSLLVRGRPGMSLAIGYVSGGLYLFLRFYAERRVTAGRTAGQTYMAQNVLLVVFIAALVYALLHVGALA